MVINRYLTNGGAEMEKFKKEEYVRPEIEVIRFEAEDIITTSGVINLPDMPF